MDKKDINLCFIEDPHAMHECSITIGDKQRHCSFYEKSRFVNKCTHFQMDCFCQNTEAYPTAKTVRVKAEDLPDTTGGEGQLFGDSILKHIQDVGKILDEQDVPARNRILRHMVERVAPGDFWKEHVSEPVGEPAVLTRDMILDMAKTGTAVSRLTQEYTIDGFLKAVSSYIDSEIGGNGWDDRLHLMRYKDMVTLGQKNAFQFEFETRFGELIYVAWHLRDSRPLDDHNAARSGVMIARDAIRYYSSKYHTDRVELRNPPRWS